MKRKPETPSPLCFSYLRFSSREQGKGDSLTRQREARDAWLARQGLELDGSLVMTDAGVSAFKGNHKANPDRHALAGFLELVKAGRIPRGSYLLVESLDRLSREHIRPALTLLLNLIDAGIRVVQLLPVEAIYDEDVEPMGLLMAVMELSRGHSESAVKSERVGRAWGRLKARAAAEKVPITREVPAWLTVEGGRFVVKPGAAEAIRRVYALATSGVGINGITRRLNSEKVAPFGDSPTWVRASVAKLLQTRKVLGEYQPYKGTTRSNRTPDGPPVPDYYPKIVSPDDWAAARFALESRRTATGPLGKRPHIFQGLLTDPRDGATIYREDKGVKGGGAKLVNGLAASGKGGAYVSFPLDVFEREVLGRLREIDVRDVMPGERADDDMPVLLGRRADLEGRIARIQSQMVAGDEDVGPLVSVLRRLQGDLDGVNTEVTRAQQRAASPIAGAWSDCRSLLALLDGKGDKADARARLRGALRRAVERIYCLFVRRGNSRLAAVRVQFHGGAHRDYLIVNIAPHGRSGRKGYAKTLSFAEAAGLDGFDLRDPADARKLEHFLTRLDPSAL